MGNYICPICRSDDHVKINTYKHLWYVCNDCSSAFSQRKEKYLFSGRFYQFLFRILNKLAGGRLAFIERNFLRVESVVSDQSQYYSKYAKYLADDDPVLNNWKAGFLEILKRLNELEIDPRNKKILFISGGPGIVAKQFEQFTKHITVTEFEQQTVDAMQKYLGLKSVKYDLNLDNLSTLFSGTFDIVFINSVINFSLYPKSFIAQLKAILNKNGIVYVNNDTATLGYMLTWQFDEYTPLSILHPEAFLRLFQATGFRKVEMFKHRYNCYLYRLSKGGWKNKIVYALRTPFWILYGIPAWFKNINREMDHKGKTYILRSPV